VKDDSIGQGKFSTQFDLLLHAYATKEKAKIRPFLTGGLGAGIFPNRSALYAPLGTGVHIAFSEGAHLLLQAQWRLRLTKGITNDYIFYSVGLAQTLPSRKKSKESQSPQDKYEPVPVIVSDKDMDGFPDSTDLCPDIKGTINGCPDRDGDKIPDIQDNCPDQPGTIQGCPDSDNDGIINLQDSCPTTPGILRYNGCPVPDRDSDGVADDEDACPDIKGLPSLKGCPEIKQEVKAKVDFTAKNILFQTSSARLRSASFASLNELIKILKEDPTLKLTIEAHTDNQGD